MELIKMLTDQLGISDEQAQGGAGLLFKMAREKLGVGEYEQVSAHLPEVDALADRASESGFLGSTLGGLAASLSGGKSNAGHLAGLVGAFAEQGLDADMLGKFVPIILSFVKNKEGAVARDILSKVLK
jgi:hypothetical protein